MKITILILLIIILVLSLHIILSKSVLVHENNYERMAKAKLSELVSDFDVLATSSGTPRYNINDFIASLLVGRSKDALYFNAKQCKVPLQITEYFDGYCKGRLSKGEIRPLIFIPFIITNDNGAAIFSLMSDMSISNIMPRSKSITEFIKANNP